MKNPLTTTTFITIALLVFAAAASGQTKPRPILGGYSVIQDPENNAPAKAAADFALETQSEKADTEFTLEEIFKAERQSAMGTNFRFCLKITSGEEEDAIFVLAIVHSDLKQKLSLTSWTVMGEGCKPKPKG